MDLKDAYKKFGVETPKPISKEETFQLKTPPQEIYKPRTVQMVDVSLKGIRRFTVCKECGQPIGGEREK